MTTKKEANKIYDEYTKKHSTAQDERIQLPACTCGWDGKVTPAHGQRCPACGEWLT